ncbi:hypothetical protein D3C76_1517680 [compost metagenome]
MFKIEANAQFPTIKAMVQRTGFADPSWAEGTAQFTFWWLNLDHLRPHIRQQHGAGRPGGDLSEVQNGQPLQSVTQHSIALPG